MASDLSDEIDRPNSDRIESLRADTRGTVLLPEDDGYDEARTIWNGMIDRRPAVIVQCTGTADVVAAVDAARETNLEVSIHGGGHNVAGKAVTEGGLMIDCSPMRGVRVDPQSETVWVQGGATLGDVDHETQLMGLATPLGAISKTGVAGLTLNGGYGHLSREYGLTADNLVAADVVTADGEVRVASEDSHSDLFWAIRGGGGNFGVVTAFEFELHEVGPEVYTFFVWYHADDARAVFDAFREWTTDAPRNVGVLPFFAYVPELEEFPSERWGEPALALLGSGRGDLTEAAAAYDPIRQAATPIADLSGRLEFEALQQLLDEDYPDGLRYYWKSIFLEDLTGDVFEIARQYHESMPSHLSTIDVWHLGGAVSDVPQDATAFWHRDKPYMLTVEANWEDPSADDANLSWAREAFDAVADLPVASGRYGNFPGMAEDPAQLLYGENYARLVDVKTKYDPENLFHLNQNVAPRGSGER